MKSARSPDLISYKDREGTQGGKAKIFHHTQSGLFSALISVDCFFHHLWVLSHFLKTQVTPSILCYNVHLSHIGTRCWGALVIEIYCCLGWGNKNLPCPKAQARFSPRSLYWNGRKGAGGGHPGSLANFSLWYPVLAWPSQQGSARMGWKVA